MFIANDSNYSFGKFLAVVSGDDIKAPVYTKCFTDTEALKGYRFIHDAEETDPEKCVCFSIYNETSSAATATAFKANAVVSDLTAVLFRLDTAITGGVLRNVPYYHVIVPVLNIKDDTLKYLVIKMTKEVELFPENYPYYELVSTFADAKPTSADSPVITPTGTITITENDTYDVTNYASAAVNVPGITPTGTLQITENDTYDVTNYASAEVNVSGGSSDFSTATVTFINDPTRQPYDVMALPHIVNEKLITDNITVTTQTDVVIPLYKGYAYSSLLALRDTDTQADPTTTGDISIDWESADLDIIISGNGTFTAKGLPVS